MEDDDKACTLSLSLELGLGGGYVPKKEKQKVNKPVASTDLTLEAIDVDHDDMAKGFSLQRSVHEEHQLSNEKSTNNTNNKARAKKLRLTKEQSDMLEDTFMLHNTINPAQKRALAEQLNLKHRQVEVWFQNRRARTKLKQTEVNCALLQKCHEKLTKENLRLKKELEELRALKLVGPSPPYTQPSKAANWTVCSSCKKVVLKPNEGNNAAISDVVQKSSY